jgi:hypothetical protein
MFFLTEARSHRVPDRCVSRSRLCRDSLPRPEALTSSSSCLRGGRSTWCVPSCFPCLCASVRANFFPTEARSHRVPDHCVYRLHHCRDSLPRSRILTSSPSCSYHDAEDQHGVSPVAHCRDSLPRSKILTSSPSCSYHDAEDQHGVSPVAQGPSPPGLRGVSSECT